MQALVSRLDAACTGTTDGLAAGIMRIMVGIAALLQILETAHILHLLSSDTAVATPFFTLLPGLSSGALLPFGSVWVMAALAFAVGWHARPAGVVLASVMTYSVLVDQQSYSNHVYLMILAVLLLTMANAGNRLSVDARLGRSRAESPAWPLMLLRIQLSIVYFFAAASKVNLVYISGSMLAPQIANSWLVPVPDAWVRWEVMLPLATVSILTEMFLAFALWSGRYRRMAIVVGAGLHSLIVIAFPLGSLIPLAVFGMVMLAMYVPFVDLAGVRQWLDKRRVAEQSLEQESRLLLRS